MNLLHRIRWLNPRRQRQARGARRAGLSIVELLMALAITAMLLTATMAAMNASFRAYADASEQASAQTGSRIVMHRLITLIRTSTAHGPLNADASVTPAATISGNTITSPYIELLDRSGNLVRMEHRANTQELWVIQTPLGGGTSVSQPILGGVTAATFTLTRRRDNEGIWVLERGTADISVQPGQDTTLALENGNSTTIRLIASTKPRRIEE